MNREVLITVRGEQIVDGQRQEPVVTITRGMYYFKNGKHYILYEEMSEGASEAVRNRVKLKEDSVEIRKQGAVTTQMTFETGKKTRTSYPTPFGSLFLDFSTSSIEIVQQERAISLTLHYDMAEEERHLAECFLTMQIEEL